MNYLLFILFLNLNAGGEDINVSFGTIKEGIASKEECQTLMKEEAEKYNFSKTPFFVGCVENTAQAFIRKQIEAQQPLRVEVAPEPQTQGLIPRVKEIQKPLPKPGLSRVR